MPTMAIDRLTLKLPGLSGTEGERLARRIAEGLAAGPTPAEPGRHLSTLRLELAPPQGADVETLAQLAVAGIMRQLR